jgi:hypothetical protein
MLLNPFTPSEIASQPEDFFGRRVELQTLERSLMQGSVAIQGAIGIGKSSLLARARLTMEGFGQENSSISTISIGHKDVTNVDEAARLLLESFADIDEASCKIKINLGKLVEIESAEICRIFADGRHLAGLMRCIDKIDMDMILSDKNYLILAIDEADKCPVPLARLIRTLTTHMQQKGIQRVRFAVAGVNPYFQKMVDEDSGINRFFYHVTSLKPMSGEEASDLVSTKFEEVTEQAEIDKLDIYIDPEVENRIVRLSGGHPHIIQLLGSHVIEHENQNPDGVIDLNDLINSLRTICYEDRSYAYESTIHFIEINNQYDALRQLIALASSSFPTIINRHEAIEVIDATELDWFVNHNILNPLSANDYGLMDEFLRVRMIMDEETHRQNIVEKKLIENGRIIRTSTDQLIIDESSEEFSESFNEDIEDYSANSREPLDFDDDS